MATREILCPCIVASIVACGPRVAPDVPPTPTGGDEPDAVAFEVSTPDTAAAAAPCEPWDCFLAAEEIYFGAGDDGTPAGDDAEARDLFLLACEGGVEDACHFLGAMWKGGRGGPADEQRAWTWWEKACDMGWEDACFELEEAEGYEPGDPEKMCALREESCTYYDDEEACWKLVKDCGVDPADMPAGGLWALGNVYAGGLYGAEPDPELARELYARACDDGDTWGCEDWGWMLREGEGGAEDDEAARVAFAKACGWPGDATIDAIREGGIIEDPQGICGLLDCDITYPEACHVLADMWARGEGGPEDLAMTRAVLTAGCLATTLTKHTCCPDLAKMMVEGIGGPSDPGQAKTILEVSCDDGWASSCDALESLF